MMSGSQIAPSFLFGSFDSTLGKHPGMTWMTAAAWAVGLYVALVSSAFIAMGLISLPPTNVTAVWIPAGIALSAMLVRMGWSALPVIFIANWTVIAGANGYPFFTFRPFSLLICGINTIGPALSYIIWRRWLIQSPFADGVSYLKFTFGVALVPALVTAWMVVAVIYLAGFLPDLNWNEFCVRSGVITVSNALGVFLIVPLVVAPLEDGIFKGVSANVLGHIGVLLVTLLVAWISFYLSPLAIYLMIPLVLACAIISGNRAVALSVLIVSFFGLVCTAKGLGPFIIHGGGRFRPIFEMAIFAFALSLPGQFCGIVLGQLRRHRARLADEVLERTERLTQSEERYRLAIEGVSDGIFDYDVEKGGVSGNGSFTGLFWKGRNEARTFSINELRLRMIEPDKIHWDRVLELCVSGGRNDLGLEVGVVSEDGQSRWVLIRGSVIDRDVSGGARRIIGTATDISIEKERQRALAMAKESAEAADRAKSEFLAAMSHEIRTPMNGVLGYARLMQTTTLDQDQGEFVESILTSGELLLALLNDILDLSKIEAGAMSLESVDFSLRQTIDEVCRLFRSAAEEKDLRFHVDYNDDCPKVIRGDANRLKQVVSNLVSNAVKFTASGSIEVRIVCCCGEEGADAEIAVSVKDTGIGISDEQRSRLFRSFSQADQSISRRFGGSGLGLVISKRLCELMGGALSVVSVPGQGSTFTARFRMKVGRGSGARRLTATPFKLETSGRRLRVLVAEDNALNRRLIKLFLDRLGHETVFVVNGAEAVDIVRAQAFDLILMDVQMPEMDGPSAARLIREEELSSGRTRIPIIATTAAASGNDRDQCLEAGMDMHLSKPIDLNELRGALASVDRLKRGPGR